MSELVLGIDTGGTYTDGVLFDREPRQVLATTKTLTTHQDLSKCILTALDALLPNDPSQVRLVSISTTLATNAIAEGKGRPAALFLLGYDPELVRTFRFESRFATSHFYYIQGGHNLNGEEQMPLDEETLLAKALEIQDQVEAYAVSGYFSPFNGAHEEQAAQILANAGDRPVVLGGQLSGKLNSIQRATTATLNASLMSILKEFLEAMRNSLDERGLRGALMVVRGDGALMNAGKAAQRPVEFVHSGPAASAIGARFLAGVERGLVIDVGGTTTDITVLDGGQVIVREEGTTVGDYSTAVRAANIRSIGLGGDSLIHFDVQNNLEIGPVRVVPLSYLAHLVPRVERELTLLEHRMKKRFSPDHLEYWYLRRKPRRILDHDAQQVIDMLADGPLSLPTILEKMDVYHPLQFGGQALLQDEIVGRAALTPTDLLHLSGEFAPWSEKAASAAAMWMARLSERSIEELILGVKTYFAERIVAEVIEFISGQSLERKSQYTSWDDLGLWLFEESLYKRNPYLGSRISLKMPIIGIGAPAGIFLPKAAELLGTELILPPNYQVANAVGAVAGSVIANTEAWIIPQMSGLYPVGYFFQSDIERRRFKTQDEAIEYAHASLCEQAVKEARAAGAVEPSCDIQHLNDGGEVIRLRATAVGNPKLGADA